VTRSLAAKVRKASALRRIPVAAVRELVADSQALDVPSGTVLFEEGDAAGPVYLVLRGAVQLSKALGEGRSATVAMRGALDWLGELSLKSGDLRSATARTEGNAQVLQVPRARFVALLREHPAAALDLLDLVARRLRESDESLLDALRKRTEELLTANERLGSEVQRLRRGDAIEHGLEAFVGRSALAIRVRKAGARAARSSAPVLLVGEPGVGKELLARCIHEAGARSDKPFVSLDCGTFGGPALEAEIFGHARGALPGVRDDAAGALEKAHGGSVYLANVDALPRPVQGMLHRFLELGEFARVGESRVRRSDVRVLAGIAGDPAEAVRGERLRSDLLARLDVMRIPIAPLRQRRNDVPLIAVRLMQESAGRHGIAPPELAPSALRVMTRYDYPENVDELAGEIEELCAGAGPAATVTSRDLSAKFVQGDPSTSEHYSEAVRAFKAQIITDAVMESGGHRSRAAERLGLHPSNLSRMIRDLELDDVL
jgi:DNA-binding NtrC family response regulator